MAHQVTGETGAPAGVPTPRVAVETNGIDVSAESGRRGTPRQLFWPWFGASVSVLGLAYGAFTLGFGIPFWQVRIPRPVAASIDGGLMVLGTIPRGRYRAAPPVPPVPLVLLALGTVLGRNLVGNTYAGWLQWQGYLLGALGLGGKTGDWGFANLGVLVAIDVQHVFADLGSPWGAPGFAGVHPAVRRLTAAFAGRVGHTRFVAPAQPAGAWVPYDEQFPFALQPPDAPPYALVDEPGDAPVLAVTTFGTWGPELAAHVGGGPIVLAGVSTDCCVLSTALPAADAGVPVHVVTDACAGASDADHDRALAAMALYAPLLTLTTTDAVLTG